MKHKIGILGAGTWGMALARMLTVSGNDVTVWSALEQEIDNLSTTRVHPNLPGMTIPAEMKFTKSVEEVCTDKEILLFAVPSVFVRSTAAKARPFVPDGQIIVDVAKGIEKDTLFTMTEILADELGKEGGPKGVRLVALSGPTHAEEVAIDLPTTIVSASKDMEAARFVQTVFTNNVMRVYTNEDIKGVELSGAMKNVIALGVGISTGLGYGDNARAALITRGIAELARLGVAMGCNVHTFAGLAGIGDLIVTATSMHSRNNRAGILIGKGETPEQAVKEVGMVVEGMNALPAALELAAKHGVPVVTTGAGMPGKVLDKLKPLGTTVIPVVASVSHAERIAKQGADAVIAEGMEAGGHIGEITTMNLVPQIADAVNLPVIAAGGIADGRGAAAAFVLGATGVQMGTRFVCAEECNVHINYKQKIVKANDRATAVTGRSLGHPVRAIKNKFIKQYEELEKRGASAEELEALGAGKLRLAVVEGDTEMGSLMAGQSAGLVHAIEPAAVIIESVISQMNNILSEMARYNR